MRTVSIMQPYLFPYVGYFCLIQASDIFVFYDDVNYIKQGWVNRNRILLNGAPHTFSVPLENGSSFEQIGNVRILGFSRFKDKFMRTLSQSYGGACCYRQGMDYVDWVLDGDFVSISQLAMRAVVGVFEILGVHREFIVSSERFPDTKGLERSERIVSIVKSLNGSRYFNSIGGMGLYDKSFFSSRGVELGFVEPYMKPYAQYKGIEFVPGLSVIDILMNNDLDAVKGHFISYNII